MTRVEKCIIIVASLLACAIIGILLYRTLEYKKATDEYDNLQEQFAADTSMAAEGEAVAGEVALEPEEEEKQLKENYFRGDFPSFEPDFDSLREINQDTVAWLYVGACGISYPVVQGEDNDYYMHRTFEDTPNSAGSIIMDYRDNNQLEDWNTFFYGHNMKNGSMFGSLKKFISDDTLRDTDPYIYVYIPGYIYRYKIFSYFKDAPDSKMYWTADTLQEYRQYIRDAQNMALVKYDDVEVSEDNNMITLVTCSGMGAGKMRFFVQGEFVDRYIIKPRVGEK